MKFRIMGGIHINIVTQIVILTFFSQARHISLKKSKVEHKICQKYKPFSKLGLLENVLLFKLLTSRLSNSAWQRNSDFGNVIVIVNNLSFSDDKKIAVVSRFLK